MDKTKQNTQPVHINVDTTSYVIVAYYPATGETEVLGIGTQAYGLKLGMLMDRDVNILFM